MKKFLVFLASLLIGVALLFWIGKTVGWQEIRSAFLVFTGWQGIVILVLTFFTILIGVWEWKVVLSGLGVNIAFKDLFAPYIAGFSIKYLAPMIIFGQETFRSYVLKKKNSLSWSKGITSGIIDRILDFTAELVFIFLGITFFLLKVGPASKDLLIYCFLILLFTIGIVSFFYFKVFKRESILKIIIKPFLSKYKENPAPFPIELEIFNFFKIKKKYMWQGFFLTFFEKTLKLFRTWVLILFLGKFVNFLPALAVVSFSYLTAMIPIPAQLGSHEAIQTFVFEGLGLEASKGVAFAMITKGAELILVIFGMIIFFALGVKLSKKNLL
jgi:uncharacterized protein (TIRG00374 family)